MTEGKWSLNHCGRDLVEAKTALADFLEKVADKLRQRREVISLIRER
jgi:hypothetical protein